MKIIRLATAVSMLVVPAIVSSASAIAQTVTQNAGVSVHRGVDAAADQRRVTKARSDVTVYRGSSNTPAPASAPVQTQPQLQARGGDKLWIVDPDNGNVVGCELYYTYYGTREVRCSSDR
jgi:hypothetical protein